MLDPSAITNAQLLAAACRASSPEALTLSRVLLVQWVASLDGNGMADLWDVRVSLELEREERAGEVLRRSRSN